VASVLPNRVATMAQLAAMLIVAACADATSEIPPTPEASAVPVSAIPNPSPTGRDVILSSGKTVLRGTFLFDFETGGYAKSNTADVWWEQVDSTRRYLVPENGARLALMGSIPFENVKRLNLLQLQFTVDRLDGSNSSTNELVAGTVIAVLTHNRHPAKVRVEQYGYDLTISWVTYE
jgi:hypothetical protein